MPRAAGRNAAVLPSRGCVTTSALRAARAGRVRINRRRSTGDRERVARKDADGVTSVEIPPLRSIQTVILKELDGWMSFLAIRDRCPNRLLCMTRPRSENTGLTSQVGIYLRCQLIWLEWRGIAYLTVVSFTRDSFTWSCFAH